MPEIVGFYLLLLVLVIVLLVAAMKEEGWKKKLQREELINSNMADMLMGCGVKVIPQDKLISGVGYQLTNAAKEHRQANYIGSQWNLDRILDTEGAAMEAAAGVWDMDEGAKHLGEVGDFVKNLQAYKDKFVEEQALKRLEKTTDDLHMLTMGGPSNYPEGYFDSLEEVTRKQDQDDLESALGDAAYEEHLRDPSGELLIDSFLRSKAVDKSE